MIVTLDPTHPLIAVTVVFVGAGMTVKLVALVAVPPGVVTRTGPVVLTIRPPPRSTLLPYTPLFRSLPLNVTAVAPVKFVPLIVTLAPTGPLAGVTLVIVGAGMTVKLVALVAVPPGVVTLTGPVVAPVGTVA